MDDKLTSTFVMVTELGFLTSTSELPHCTETLHNHAAFILKDKEGPDLRTCELSYSSEPNEWCGKNREDCIEG
ncbi:hypothetical protein SAMN02745866_03980 [Alteromonadaceae bacterium Bs31]|nr:hypothetical protein SAMN02745866_03980 [Alteromonadaceae bacterium Bs31]